MNVRNILIAAALALAAAMGAEAGIPGGATQKQIVHRHNKIRASYGAPPLTWSGTIAKTAYSFTNTCTFAHDVGSLTSLQLGENISQGTRTWATSINLWLNEAPSYKFSSPGFSSDTGHFTQVVWKATKKVGCAMTHCPGGDMWSCRYYPAGNYGGQFASQVGR